MKIGLVLRELHRSENDLAHELLKASEHNKVDQEMYHLARDLAGWSQRHIPLIAGAAHRYGEDLNPEPETELKMLERIRESTSDLIGGRSDASLLMLRDLRLIYTKASGVSTDWEMLAQAAQGIKHTGLLAVTKKCHPDTLRQMRWANTKLKESSTQVLLS